MLLLRCRACRSVRRYRTSQGGDKVDSPLWVQLESLVVILLVLAVSAYQVWLARRQTLALQRTTEAAMTAGQAEARDSILYGDEQRRSGI